MRALLVEQLGPPESHRVHDDVEPPRPGPGEVVVDVRAAGVNYPDLLVMRGLYQFRPELPFSPGGEGAGVVSAVGEGVEAFDVGDEVSFLGSHGAFREKVAVPAATLVDKPSFMSFEEAAALSFTYGTSYYALKQRARLEPGETVAVLGAAGGVGSAAVELAVAMGAEVIAAASTEEKLEFCTELGATGTINYTTDDLKTRLRALTDDAGVDVIYDPVGGELSEAAFRAIAWNGRHLVVGFTAGDIPALPLNLPLLKHASVVGVFWGAWVQRNPKAHAANTAELHQMVQAERIRPRIDSVFELDDHVAAFARIADRKVMGKVVLRISG
jgi:NADPH2:quinone reductase